MLFFKSISRIEIKIIYIELSFYGKNFLGRVSEICANHDRELFEQFLKLNKQELKKVCSKKNGEPFHLVRSEFFDLAFMDKIYTMAKIIKKLESTAPMDAKLAQRSFLPFLL